MEFVIIVITKHFRPNPYFENEVLSKEVVMEGPGETTVTDTQILWKEGKVGVV